MELTELCALLIERPKLRPSSSPSSPSMASAASALPEDVDAGAAATPEDEVIESADRVAVAAAN